MRITLIVTITADGFIAGNNGDAPARIAFEDTGFFREKSKEIGTVIMGSNTYRAIQAPLAGRHTIVMSETRGTEQSDVDDVEFFSGEARDLTEVLSRRGVTEAVLAGGSQLNASFLAEQLVDEIYIVVAPRLIGRGLSISDGYALDIRLRLADVRPQDADTVFLHYHVIR